MRAFQLSIALAALALCTAAATVEGVAYDVFSLEPVSAIVEANSTPRQVAVAANGSYSLELQPGSYALTAKTFSREGDELVLSGTAEENITVAGEGRFHLDLIIMPLVDEIPLLELPEIPQIDENSSKLAESAAEEAAPSEAQPWLLYGGALLALLAAAGALFILRGRRAPPARPSAPAESKPVEEKKAAGGELTTDERTALDALSKADGRLGQKELRKMLGWSGAKASLVVTGLEEKGAVRRIRKGRGNIVRITG